MLTYPAGGLKVGLVFIYIHTLFVRAAKALVKFKKNIAQAYWIRGTCDKRKISCTDAYIRVDKLYKHKSIWAIGRCLILASVAHLRKRLSLRLWESWG